MVAGQARVDTVAVGDRTTGELRKQRHRLRGDAVVAAPALAGPTKGCAVLKVTLKGLLAHRARLVLTAVAVLIGVALVAGTLAWTWRSATLTIPRPARRRRSAHSCLPRSGRCRAWGQRPGWSSQRSCRWSAGTAGRSATSARSTW